LFEVRGNGVDVTSQAFQQSLQVHFAPLWNLFGQHALKLRVECFRHEDLSVSCQAIAEVVPFGLYEAETSAANEHDAIAETAEQLLHTLSALFNTG
jgi:hypothetical protein